MAFDFGILAAFGAMLAWGLGDFLIQRSVRRVGRVHALAFIAVTGTIMLLPLALQDMHLLLVPQNLALLLFLGLFALASSMITFRALGEGKLSIVMVVFALELPLTVLLSTTLLGEALSLVQFAAIAIVFAGVLLVSVSSLSAAIFSGNLEKGALLAVASAASFAIMNYLLTLGARQASPAISVWFIWLVLAAAPLLLIFLRRGFGSFRKNFFSSPRLLLATGFFDTIGWLLFTVALVDNKLAIVAAIMVNYTTVGLLLGVLINREKISAHQYAGAAIALAAGVALALIA
ncbi:MAG: EamA family transporter [Candidatus Diapherotrites archaeon]